MEVTSLPNLNLITAQCGCCPLPTCADPKIICESLTHKTNCGDNDYTDSHDLWLKLSTDHASWASTHAAFPAAHAAWVTAHAAWAMEDPCERGPEPVEPVDPPEPPTGGTEPEEPEDYGDPADHGCYTPFAEPDMEIYEPTDELPTIYGYRHGYSSTVLNGTSWAYQRFAEDTPGPFDTSSEYRSVETYTNWPFSGFTGLVTDDGFNFYYHWLSECASGTSGASNIFGVFDSDGYTYTPEVICSPTIREHKITGVAAEGDATAPTDLVGCGVLASYPGNLEERGYDLTSTDRVGEELSEPRTKTTLIARAIANLPATFPDEPEGSSCTASTVVAWPKIKDVYVGADPEADPPVAGAWPNLCGYDEEAGIFTPGGYGSIPETFAESTKVRYKMGIPLLYQAHRLWIIEHAEWVACDALGCIPDTCGTEPAEPQIFHYYAIQWDVVFFPKKWEEWRVLWLAWKAAVVAHDQWVIDHAAWVMAGSDPETEPEEPAVPDDPTADQPEDGPVFINENLFWVWTGGETEAEQYETDWHTIDAPTTEGESRIVNKQVKCWQSARIGVPPSPVGEIYNPADYE